MAALITTNVDYTPFLDVGTGHPTAFGFQGNFSTLWVSAASPQTGGTGRIQEGINLAHPSTFWGISCGITRRHGEDHLAPVASPAQVVINGNLTLGLSDTPCHRAQRYSRRD